MPTEAEVRAQIDAYAAILSRAEDIAIETMNILDRRLGPRYHISDTKILDEEIEVTFCFGCDDYESLCFPMSRLWSTTWQDELRAEIVAKKAAEQLAQQVAAEKQAAEKELKDREMYEKLKKMFGEPGV